MEYIYYCVACNKFHIAETEKTLLHPCPHCPNQNAVCTDCDKVTYSNMDNDTKEQFKQDIKSKFTADYCHKIIGEYYEEVHKQYMRENGLYYDYEGCRGRHISVYEDRCVITTNVSFGSVLTGNALDGEKTIFYKDVVGIQYKDEGLTIGYLQLETPSLQMNNNASNQFSENTFTFEKAGRNYTNKEIREMKDFIIKQVSKYKKLDTHETCDDLKTICDLYERKLLTEEEFNSMKNRIMK